MGAILSDMGGFAPARVPELFPAEEVAAKRPDRCPYAQIVANYNLTCISLPKCSQLSEGRKIMIRARFVQADCPADAFLAFFQKVEASDFLTGRSATEFRASFDWLFNASNFVKITEGNYDNRGTSSTNKHRSLTPDEHRKF